jgi:hypothetical protein
LFDIQKNKNLRLSLYFLTASATRFRPSSINQSAKRIGQPTVMSKPNDYTPLLFCGDENNQLPHPPK